MTRPIIAFTYSSFQSILVRLAMQLAIVLSGGKALAIHAKKFEQLPDFDGLILGGGVDIHPGQYHAAAKVNYRYDPARDRMELQLLENALAKNKPVLGVCRGCQLINIYRQGSLHEDIRKIDEVTEYPGTLSGYIFFRKTITIDPESLLYECIGNKTAQVNSIHKQCINHLGHDLKVTAAEKNKIIQCIEDPNEAFVMGVQFHPEFLIYKRAFLNIFRRFVKEARFVKPHQSTKA